MSEHDLPPVRRVVTGYDRAGRSIIEADGSPSAVRTVRERPGYRVANVWATFGSLAPVDAPDRTGELTGVLPPAGGTVIRVIDFPPEPRDSAERDRQIRATFGHLFRDAAHPGGQDLHPGMHETDTTDYAIVLAGEIWAVMETGETLLRAGDILVQRGTNHAWANRSEKPCRIAFVLVSGSRRPSAA